MINFLIVLLGISKIPTRIREQRRMRYDFIDYNVNASTVVKIFSSLVYLIEMVFLIDRDVLVKVFIELLNFE